MASSITLNPTETSQASQLPSTVSGSFARFAAGLEFGQIPGDLVQKAKGHMLDALGIALASTGFDYAGADPRRRAQTGRRQRRPRPRHGCAASACRPRRSSTAP